MGALAIARREDPDGAARCIDAGRRCSSVKRRIRNQIHAALFLRVVDCTASGKHVLYVYISTALINDNDLNNNDNGKCKQLWGVHTHTKRKRT